MDARQLLHSIEVRGGVATVKREGDAVKINIAPRSLALELLPDLQRFKPALIELLAPTDAAARDRVSPEIRRVFPNTDVLAIGRFLLCLDNGEEIETHTIGK
jgi:hypothetical protein